MMVFLPSELTGCEDAGLGEKTHLAIVFELVTVEVLESSMALND